MAYIAKQDFSEILNGDYIENIYVEGKAVKAVVRHTFAEWVDPPDMVWEAGEKTYTEVLGTYTSNRHAQNALTTFMNILNGNHIPKRGGK